MSDDGGYKPKGGAQKLRERKARNAAYAKAAAVARGEDVGPAKFRQLGLPPANAIGTVAFANRAAGLLLHDVLLDEALEEPERRRVARELIQAIGMNAVKALYEEGLKKIEQELGIAAKAGREDGAKQYKPLGRLPRSEEQ